MSESIRIPTIEAKSKMEEGKCPMCNCEELEYGSLEIMDNIVRYPFTCTNPNCKYEGGEDYTLNFSGFVVKTKEGQKLVENPD